MRKKRKKASAVIVDGIVHAIGELEPEFVTVASDEPGESWDRFARGKLGKRTRAQRKADRARAIREKLEPRVSLLCEVSPRMIGQISGGMFRMPPWLRVPRTHAVVDCMTCIVRLGSKL